MSQKLDKLYYTRCPVPTGLGIAVQQGKFQDAIKLHGATLESLRESADKAVRES
ncbi:MAG: ABC transporter substrate-binding protein, partial [Methylocystaceae bacterium]